MSVIGRDYSLVGPEAARARERGLADGEWFQADIDANRLSELMTRTNARAGVDMVLWLALIVVAGTLAWTLRSSWWAIPAFAAYGALAGGSADPRWHECGHGTAFRTRWLNDVFYYPASFMIARGATYWRWSHFRHHTDTIVVGRDPEIVFSRPPSFGGMIVTFSNLIGGPKLMWASVKHAAGQIDDVTREIVPEPEIPRVVREARVYVAIWAAAIVATIATWTPWPILFVGGPTIYGAWMMVFFGATQHTGLREDVLDHRYSTRTVLMNPVFRFLYLNMNYHIEHHMYPSVPYRSLPTLHDEIADQLPEPLPSTPAAYKEIFTAIRHQHNDPTWELDRVVSDVPGHLGRIEQAFSWAGGNDEIDLGPANVGLGELRPVNVGGQPYVLACLDDRSCVLVDRMCTHGNADLSEGLVIDGEIECPKHNGRFDLRTGQPTRKPVSEPLTVRVVEIRSGRMVVATPDTDDASQKGLND